MEKFWIDGVDGKELIEEIASRPEVRNYIRELSLKHISFMEQGLVRMNLVDACSDRKFLIHKSEIDGARAMLSALLAPLEQQQEKKGAANARTRK